MFALLGLVIALTPYDKVLPGANRAAAEIEIYLGGRANEAVRLRVAPLPAGWIASFCSPRICSLSRIGLVLPASGTQMLQLALIRNDGHAAAPRSIVLQGSDRARATIAFSAVALK